ncbi:hypothetical protein K0W35_004443 [Vibrio parahaemolyticus]|nr:hypothetical protein [Vibrio parahaemolyticus]
MLAFLKKWRKAYLEDKGDRLHAQVEAERNTLCHSAIPVDAVSGTFRDLHRESTFKNEFRKWAESINETMDDSSRHEDWNGRERY